ncbi:hypothetical protein OSB04_027733 [Centaurea solstitialis]|uniref:Ubiquitin-like protease family profile domain-containing protein n=1 Tax=Centaurea solstitialis TaxID=347529 RepID=A0AA38SXX8_9ASTR|nr:hypothetical protein OSB04_027733 [Centaurea solstitialis]
MSKEIDDSMDDLPLSKSFARGKRRSNVQVSVNEDVKEFSEKDYCTQDAGASIRTYKKRKTKPANGKGKKEEDKQKKSNKKQRVMCEGRTLSIRTSPKNLMIVMRTLRPLQRKWVEEIGLESILHLHVDTIPSKLAFGIVNAFDSEQMLIRTSNGDIEVNNESVSRILGLKNEGLDIKAFETEQSWYSKIESWKEQFDDRSCIRAQEVQMKITESERDDWNFRLNFIILFINSMAESSKMGLVNSTILSHLPSELDFKMINWCKYICDCARDAKNAWSSKVNMCFYTGPITFLMLLYVDSTSCEAVPHKRLIPAIREWKTSMLNERQKYELNNGGFGKLKLNNQQAEVFQVNLIIQSEEEILKDIDDDLDYLSEKKKSLECKIIEKMKLFPNNKDLKDRKKRFEQMFKMDEKLILLGDTDKGKGIFVEQQEDNATEDEEEGNVNQKDVVVETSCQNSEMNYDDIATSMISSVVVDINQISKQLPEEEEENENEKMDQGFTEADEEKRNELQKKNEEEEKRKKEKEQEEIQLHKKQQEEQEHNRSQVEKEIDMKKKKEEENRRKQGKQKENKSEKDMEKGNGDEMKKRKMIINFKKGKVDIVEDNEKRIQSVSDVLKSPFKIRIVGINSKPNANDLRFANTVFALQGKKSDILFETKEGDKCLRFMLASMIPGSEVYYNVLDTWCILLNHEERLKSKESPSRLFFPTSPGEMFQEESTDERRIELFWTNICAFMEKYTAMEELKKIQLVFFPIVSQDHSYVICFDLKNGSFHILDNSAVDIPDSAKYGKLPTIVKKVFIKTLKFIDDGRAKKLSKAKQKREKMVWRTTENKIDCGIFVMRHMETFMGGNVSKWVSGFALEGDAQKNQIENLRYKYVARILQSTLNINIEFVKAEVDTFAKQPIEKQEEVLEAAKKIKDEWLEIAEEGIEVVIMSEEENHRTMEASACISLIGNKRTKKQLLNIIDKFNTKKNQCVDQAHIVESSEVLVTSSKRKKVSKKEETKGDNAKKTRKVRSDKIEGKSLIIRTSPKNLVTAIRTLSPMQKKWIEDNGFGSFLFFDIAIIPSRLAYEVVEAFDNDKMVIKTSNGDIKVTTESVSEMLGLRNDGLDINDCVLDNEWNQRVTDWRQQYGEGSIKASDIQKKISESEDNDWNFRLNFIVLFVNSMADTLKMGTVSTSILSFLPKMDELNNINWCKYICNSARNTKYTWSNETGSSFFTGPITFLTLLYVDSTFCQAIPHRRVIPAIREWKTKMLRSREIYEFQNGGFGNLQLNFEIPEVLVDNLMLQTEEQIINELDKDLNDIWARKETLEFKVYKQMKLNPESKNLKEWKKKFEDCFIFKEQVSNLGKTDKQLIVEQQTEEEAVDSESLIQQQQKQNEEVSEEEEVVFFENANGEDCIEQLNVEGDKLNMKYVGESTEDVAVTDKQTVMMEMDENDIASLMIKNVVSDIQISDFAENSVYCEMSTNQEKSHTETDKDAATINESINERQKQVEVKELGKDKEVQHKLKDLVNDIVAKKQFQKSKAILKSVAANDIMQLYINTKPDANECRVANMVFAVQGDKEDILFKAKDGHECSRLIMSTMRRGSVVHCSVPRDIFEEGSKEDTNIHQFWNNVCSFMEKDGDIDDLINFELVFFPIVNGCDYYVICFDLQKGSFHILDNNVTNEASSTNYGIVPYNLHKVFVEALKIIKDERANKLLKAKQKIQKMSWRTSNQVDCGIFAMRHMETFMGGNLLKWHCGFDQEGDKQKLQIEYLRIKYVSEILLSNVNCNKEFVTAEVEKFEQHSSEKQLKLLLAAKMMKDKCF